MPIPEPSFQPREVCARCRRPQRVCYCAALPELGTQTRVVILQHPRERGMPIGTAHMARLCLPQAELRVGVRWEGNFGPSPILLYPGPGARDILDDPPPGPVTLVVVDGTWSQAKGVVRDNPALQALPRYAFATPEPSQYRIRSEPSEEYVSTIEALMHVLGALEGDPQKFRSLLDPLNLMVDRQLACQAEGPSRWTPRKPKSPPKPPWRPELSDDLVAVVAEANAWSYRDDKGTELVHLVAERLASGERFSAICAPELPFSPSTPHHTWLDEATICAGVPRAQLLADFAAWLRPSDRVCAWGHHGLRLVLDAGGTLPQGALDLREAAKRMLRGRIGTLDEYAATHGPPPVPALPGRAGQRLALLAQVVAAWRG